MKVSKALILLKKVEQVNPSVFVEEPARMHGNNTTNEQVNNITQHIHL